MSQTEMIAQLALIIKDFRKGEMCIELDSTHVDRWLCQFPIESREAILSETIHVLSNWYFTRQYIEEEFLDSLISFLCRKYNYSSVHELCCTTTFVQAQEIGQSQKQLIQMLRSRLDNQYGVQLNTKISKETCHFVYIDDGLYTGSRARKDLSKLICQLSPGSTLDAFYLVAGSSGFAYTKDQLSLIAENHNVALSLYRLRHLQNIKNVEKKVKHENSTDVYEESYGASQTCLWPDEELQSISRIFDYEISLKCPNSPKYLYRKKPWKNDIGVFSSIQGRKVVEREFLLKGIEVVSMLSNPKGKYPLGYNLWPSFGFGSFCATDLNISNTCPLVLWWGNVEKQGNVLDNWYPLLPRRINNLNDDVEVMDRPVDRPAHRLSPPYNLCPDCGMYFGLETDGGNGFCIDCAWKH